MSRPQVPPKLDPATADQVWKALRPLRDWARESRTQPPNLEGVMAWLAEQAMESPEVIGGQRQSISPAGSTTPHTQIVECLLLPRAAAAAYAGISESTLQRRERAGAIQAIRHGRIVRYRREDLDALGRESD